MMYLCYISELLTSTDRRRFDATFQRGAIRIDGNLVLPSVIVTPLQSNARCSWQWHRRNGSVVCNIVHTTAPFALLTSFEVPPRHPRNQLCATHAHVLVLDHVNRPLIKVLAAAPSYCPSNRSFSTFMILPMSRSVWAFSSFDRSISTCFS